MSLSFCHVRCPNSQLRATHQLRLQETIINLLFVVLYQTPKRLAAISEGLLRGCIMSSFGTSQANRKIWEEDVASQRVAVRIRDLLLLIAIESLCLGQVISPLDPLEHDNLSTLIQSKETIASIHVFLADHSNDLSPHYPGVEPGTVPLPLWPMPIICLVWSIILRSLPPALVPPAGEDGITWQDMAIRALRLPSGLFPWMEAILEGPLMQNDDDAFIGNEELYYRKVFKGV